VSSLVFINNFRKNLSYNFNISGFGNNLIHLVLPRHFNIFILCMACKSNNHWLHEIYISNILSNSIRCIVTIHNGYATVHKYQPIREIFLFECILNQV